MRFKHYLTIVLLLLTTSVVAQIVEPVQWSSKSEKIAENQYKLIFIADIDEGWYIYGNKDYEDGPMGTQIQITLPDNITLEGSLSTVSEVKTIYDEMFAMDIDKLYKKAVFEQIVNVSGEGQVEASVMWQSCNNESCIAPDDFDFTFKLGEASAAVEADTKEASTSTKVVSAASDSFEVANVPQKSLWSVIIEAIIWGFAALLTPCVFPMVPMTVSFFMKSSESKTKGRALASMYGLSIIALYTLPIAAIILITYLLGGDAVTADIFNWLSTHWLPNILFFLVFMVFAISFFGAFEIVLPSWLVNKSDEKSDKGGFIGTFFMALTLVLVSFSCTGPIVGSILVQSTQGEVWSPIVTMLAFSTAFALPFTLFAFFPSMLKNLPKSGGWLNSVKVVLGFIELALGLKFLSVADQTYHWGLLDREVYLAIWIVIFTLLGFYFLGKIKFAHDSDEPYLKVKKLFFAIITFTFVVYLIPGMFGAPLKALSGYLPPMHTHDFNLLEGGRASSSSASLTNSVKYGDKLHLPHSIPGFFDLEEATEYAKEQGKPLFVDFTGHGCVNCREMEANVWSDARVQKILSEDYVVVALYVDDKLQLPESDWVVASNGRTLKTLGKINAQYQVERFGINAQPYYVLMGDDDNMLTAPRGYDLNVEAFLQFLEEGLNQYKK